MALTFEGTTVIPLFTNSPGYREWEITRAGQDFCIVNEDGEDGDWHASGSGRVTTRCGRRSAAGWTFMPS